MAIGGMGGGGKRAALSEINVTPLVDVMLVLLIVFMVTTPIIVEEITQRKVEVDLPTTNAQPVARSELQTLLILTGDLKVTLDMGHEDGGVQVADCSAAAGAFGECLDALKALEHNQALKDGRRIFLMADRKIPYGFVVDVMARLKNAGIGNLGMVTNPPEVAGGKP